MFETIVRRTRAPTVTRDDKKNKRNETLGQVHRFQRDTLVDTSAPGAQLVVLTGPKLGQRFLISDGTLIGRDIDDGIDVDDAGASRRHAEVVRDADGNYFIRDLGSRNGTELNGSLIAESPLNFGDRIAVGVGTVMLFARHGRVEDQLFQVQKLQALGELAGGIAHDFNNLLATILTSVTYLASEPEIEPQELESSLADIESAARRAVGLTGQLLGFTRKAKIETELVDVSRLVVEATQLLKRTLNRNVEVVTELGTETGVVGVAGRLFQVLMNLSINAGDAMATGGKLTLRTERVAIENEGHASGLPPGHYVALTVKDTGTGMSDATRLQVFEPFFTTKKRGQGTGLGLAVVYGIVQEHGGSITVRSEVDRGTQFEVLLPWTPLPEQEHPEDTTDEIQRIDGRTVLFVDDEPEIRRAIQRLLERSGMRVLPASNGPQAVEIFTEDSEIDLVVLDLDLPGMDGAAVYRVLQTVDPTIPVLISSGFIQSEAEAELREAGARHFLPKPYDSATLLDAVAGILTIENS
jgi:signal transduction histidine kinase/CheY-like chemotaxis protein